MSKLSRVGEELRQAIGAAGYELTPNQLIEGLDEAAERIRPGADGCCDSCGNDGSDGRDFRFGVCENCAFCSHESNCYEFAVTTGPFTMCEDHAGQPFGKED